MKTETTKTEQVKTEKEEKEVKNENPKSIFDMFFNHSFAEPVSFFDRFFDDPFFGMKKKESEKKEVIQEESQEETEGEDEGIEVGEIKIPKIPVVTPNEEKEEIPELEKVQSSDEKVEKPEIKPAFYGFKKTSFFNGSERKETIEKQFGDKKYKIEKLVNSDGEVKEENESFENLKREEIEEFEKKFQDFGVFKSLENHQSFPQLSEPKKKKKKKKKKMKKLRRFENSPYLVNSMFDNPFGIVRKPQRFYRRRSFFDNFDPFERFFSPRYVTVAI